MAWRTTWNGRSISVQRRHWWSSGALTVDEAVADSRPCNDYYSSFAFYAALVPSESGAQHQLEVVERPWLWGRYIYQIVVDGQLVTRGHRNAPDPPDWPLRDATEEAGLGPFVFLYAPSGLVIAGLFLVARYLRHELPSFDRFALDVLNALTVALGVVTAYATIRWFNYVKVNRCRRSKLRGVPAA